MSSLAGKFEQLKLYLKALPEALPLVDIANQDAKVNRLLMFSINEEWVQDVGEEGAVNWEIEGIKELATVLEYWVTKLPGSTILQSWLKSSIDSAEKCILKYGGKLLDIQVDDAPELSRTALPPKNVFAKLKDLAQQGCQTTLDGSTVATFHKSICKDHKKPDTKALHDTEDSDYITNDESDDGCKGGKKIFPLLLRISRPCHAITDPQKKMAWCTASKGSAVEELVRKQPSLLDQLDKKMGIEKKCTHEDLSGASMEAPPLKHSRTEPLLTPICAGSSNLSFSKYHTKGRKALEEKANKALIKFIVYCGIPPHIIQHQKYKNLVNVLNGNYIPPSHTTFEDGLVPSYAAATQLTVINYLKKCRDMTLTFDGGKLGKKKFFSMHVTTTHHQSFCMELDDVDRLSQMGEYICDLLYKVVSQLQDLLAFMGLSTYTLDWFDVACKDLHIQHGLQSVGETRFGTIYWSLDSVVQGIPVFMKIIHNPGLGIDNTMLHTLFDDDEDVFAFLNLKRLGAVLMPFARAIQCLEAKDTNPVDVYTYWLAIVAHLQDLLTKDDSLKEKSKYAIELKEKIHVIANSWFAQLIEDEQASNIYLTAFVLDPENQAAPILTNPNPLAIPSVTITREKGKPTIRSRPKIIDGIRLSLLKLLQNEYGDEYHAGHSVEEARRVMEDINPHLAKQNPRKALHTLKAQFRAYLADVKPFNHKHGQNESIHDYWSWLLDNKDSDVLAALAVKIFSAMPVSMVNKCAIQSQSPGFTEEEDDEREAEEEEEHKGSLRCA
ncbi:hypothetical protein F5148DRAFT_1278106 [Russula earlei]|uniref:Uncharacterized protein n=1 Tax=Russula earlei TaxID=71964 RepID=A0ACC0TUI3_9AGAM|nr:hypothetical protein F5148DRAFT_1278106 [Russula earlei]